MLASLPTSPGFILRLDETRRLLKRHAVDSRPSLAYRPCSTHLPRRFERALLGDGVTTAAEAHAATGADLPRTLATLRAATSPRPDAPGLTDCAGFLVRAVSVYNFDGRSLCGPHGPQR